MGYRHEQFIRYLAELILFDVDQDSIFISIYINNIMFKY